MATFLESVQQKRLQFGQALAKRNRLGLYLLMGACVGTMNLVKAYHNHSIIDAVVAILLWFVFMPWLGTYCTAKKIF